MQQAISPPSSPSAARRWPEALRDQPRPPDPFPMRLFFLGLLPGLIGAMLLIVGAVYLEQRANRQILYLTPQSGLAVVRADGTRNRAITLGESGARFTGPAQWSPDGSRFAALITQDGATKVLIVRQEDDTPSVIDSSISDELQLPAAPWSDDGAYLALTRDTRQGQGELLIADVQQGRAITVALSLDATVPVSWRPQSRELLATSRTEGVTRTLHIVGVDGQPRLLTPQDQQASHADGAWSPDGQQIAYVAGSARADVGGGIWVANADGNGARAVVSDGVNFAPVWAPRGDLLFFTRLLTETGALELYRVRPDGSDLAPVGPSTPAWRIAGADRSALLSWSPDGSQLLFQGSGQQGLAVYTGLYDGSNPQPRFAVAESNAEALVARWMPTSRALLIASPSSGMLVRWVDEDRANRSLPRGSFPAIQP